MKLRMIIHISDVIILRSLCVRVLWVCVIVPENGTFVFEEIIEKYGKMWFEKKLSGNTNHYIYFMLALN